MDENQFMLDKVRQLFNEWDPIAVMSHAPVDEYEDEINEIVHMLGKADTEKEFIKIFTLVCTKYFGKNYYKLDTTSEIAGRIFNSIFSSITISAKRKEFDSICWGDAEILDGEFSYRDKIIKIPMIMDESQIEPYKATLVFYNVISFGYSILEPWGAGMYISEVVINNLESEKFEFNILLNSGDEIKVVAKEILFKRSNLLIRRH